MKLSTLLILLSSFLLLPSSLVKAQTINWSSTISTTEAGNQSYLSDGSAMPDGFTFQLGYFDGGFDALDPATWLSSWHVYDDSITPGIEGQTTFTHPIGGSPFGFAFTASTTITDSLFENQQGYIWGFNDQGLTGLAGGESLLMTDSGWTFPAPDLNVSLDWTVSSATEVVWGAIDQNITDPGGFISGGGIITTPQAANTFHMQSATFTPVPEPSSTLLLATTTLLGLLRRNRRMK